MKLPDMHLHTEHSFDSQAKMHDLCAQAAAAGIPEICFAEHFTLDPWVPTYGHLKWQSYGEDIEYNRRHFEGRLLIRKGIEICEPHLDLPGYRDVLEPQAMDCIIGSIHNIDQLKLRWVIRDFGRKNAYDRYFESLLAMVEKADIDIVAHLDLIKRYANEPFSQTDFAAYRPVIARILETIIRRGLALEINTSSMHTLGETMPTVDTLCLYRQLGGERITIGSDAHKPERVGRGIETAAELALSCGFTHYCTFEKRQAIRHEIKVVHDA